MYLEPKPQISCPLEPPQQDERFLNAALRLARKHQGLTATNPSVGCVIVKDLGNGPVIVGSAVTALGGRPHAEPPAIAEAGMHARGATAYVTLEPCAHHGRTPPCAQALIDAGIERVVTAVTDPDNRVNGKGHQMLLDAGVKVTTLDGGEFAHRVMQGYLKARQGYLPFVTLKLAMTRDGIIGAAGEGNLRISREDAIRQTHLCRARHQAIMVGSGTLIEDNPSLTCRLPGLESRSPIRVVLDRNYRLGKCHSMVNTNEQAATWVVAPADPPAHWQEIIRSHGIEHIPCELDNDSIALPELFQDLAARGIQSVMVEGGAALSGSLLEDDLVDEIIVHLGLEPELPKDPSKAIYAPFRADAPPAGFRTVQELDFGSDISLRMRKAE